MTAWTAGATVSKNKDPATSPIPLYNSVLIGIFQLSITVNRKKLIERRIPTAQNSHQKVIL